ncbi:MAG: tetrahydrodipicolinate N-succinyltransferase N-terminal domain-containing protein [Helicobacter sp.]|uniref:tetrahydrodipicolinate N-succinyltransferase N-terminal domain-containing protein n=1 Tax=Helicobacter sp. TaxID=218 RepID=UPI002A913188|nr:tetrahydrodipicolinate N-succinyltransferase N-terminal domain-containing protein [Helicobacter sp.]MDY5822438.1 tetrahydrodipicolinate N-succinyltransferase N-terminal domain-containing protein [Helicobacter sp.]
MSPSHSSISIIRTEADFKQFVEAFYQDKKQPKSFGIARAEISRLDSKSVISINFPFLNFMQNFGSFAVFATAAKLQNFENNEVVIDIDAAFVFRALCLFYPFIEKELSIYDEKHAGENTLQKFKNLCDKFSTDPYSIKTADVLFTDSKIHRHIGEKHKNIQIIFELLRHVSDIYKGENEFYKFQLVAYFDDLQTKSLQVAYAKLHALSAGFAPLRSLNLDGIFGLLPNLAWSGNKPYELQYLRDNEVSLKMEGEFPCIDFIDKFPRYLMQVLPQADNIRILDSAKTRFGAFLGAGYTQMPGASYVNFNSGTLGACMNEGRISSSVIVGEGTDIGGGASILGVLSGGNTTPISIGKNCLLGANSVTGISLGDSCIVDAGTTILAGSVVKINNEEAQKIKEVNANFEIQSNGLYKGHMLSGLNGVHFRFMTQNPCLIAFRSAGAISLNKDLH